MNYRYLLILPTLLLASISYGAEYYVAKDNNCSDRGTGTEANPWCSIQKGMTTAVAGDTVYIKAGTYAESLTIANSGTSGNYITFRNYGTDVVNIDPGNIYSEDKSYFKLIGLIVKNPPSGNPGTPGVDISRGAYIEVTDVDVTGCDNEDAAAFRWSQTDYFTHKGGRISYNDTGWQEALRVQSDSHDFLITQVEVDHNTNIGIDIVGWDVAPHKYGKPSDGVISRCNVHENSTSEPWSAGIYLDSPNNITVEYNVSWGNNRGIEMGCELNGDTSDGNIFRYNIVYENTAMGMNVGGYQGGLVTNGKVYNNVFYNNGEAEIAFDSTPGNNNKFYNNILYDPGTTLITNAGNNNLFQYNSYTGNGGLGSNYITADPLFKNAAQYDFELKQGSPCIDAGDPATAPTVDFAGKQVPLDGNGDGTVRADMGAYEYGGTPTPVSSEPLKPENLRIELIPVS